MKKILIVVSILGFCFIVSLANAATQIGLWEFENNHNDSMGNYNLIEFGTVFFVSGIGGGNAADFDGGYLPLPIDAGALDYLESVNSADVSSFNTIGLSIMGWMNHDQGDEPSVGYMLSQDRSSFNSSELGYGLNISPDGQLSFHVRDTSDNRVYGKSLVQVIPNTWTHFAVTWNGDYSGGVQMYLNGSPVATDNYLIGGNFSGMGGISMPIRIGASHGDSGYMVKGYDGQLDHLSLWQGALTPEKVLADYEAGLETVEDLLNDLKVEVNTIGTDNPDAFKNNPEQRANAFMNKIDAIIESLTVADMETDPTVQDELYNEAIDKLENDIRAKMDGCLGGNDKNDWIIACDAQTQLNTLIDKIVAAIVDVKNNN